MLLFGPGFKVALGMFDLRISFIVIVMVGFEVGLPSIL